MGVGRVLGESVAWPESCHSEGPPALRLEGLGLSLTHRAGKAANASDALSLPSKAWMGDPRPGKEILLPPGEHITQREVMPLAAQP